MKYFDYSEFEFEIREDIPATYAAYWLSLASPGNWWTGAERVAIAQETRNALACAFCVERKQALSPYGLAGRHDHSGVLDERVVDAVHRIITDQNRITRAFVDDNAANGLSKPAYVELVGIAVTVFSIDEFHRALGVPVEALPQPLGGEPSGYTPAILVNDMGFVPTIPAEGATANEADLWQPGFAHNVVRALSLVPDAVRDWHKVAGAQYLSLPGMQNMVQDENRSINRMQMELLAGRVSSVNECFY
tara:strand:- start:646 stop:1389 length:744 start_codon:yes stop_codon:yes gene_type:complete